jgi:exonuclease III
MDTIIQWNCRGLKHNFNELKLIVSTHHPIAICLQETYLKESDNISFKNYTLYNKYAKTEHGKATGGVSILIRNDIPHE